MSSYDFRRIEAKWQRRWEESGIFRTRGPHDERFDASKPKYYVLDMFPYPSGKGIHVGHPIGYIATDILARYKRMTGYNVLHPMGFDAFGLPAEQFAVETGTHPRITTEANVAAMRRQLKACGLSYDWDREVITIDPRYYRWTQWIFLQMFGSWFDPRQQKARPIAELHALLEADEARIARSGDIVFSDAPSFADARAWSDHRPEERRMAIDQQRLARQEEVPVNWCPALGTVLANEEVTSEGRSERGNFPVFRRPLRQWVLRITVYADRLLADLDAVDWPESIKLMQRNWIGRSEGARVRFPLASGEGEIEVYTTRPDTLFGATYMVLAPEHELVEVVTTPERRDAVAEYRAQASAKSDLVRQTDTRTKTGVFTGGYALNPTNGETIPIWIADYVLMGYGTGAIMAVPAHDERDFEFARTFDLPIRAVVEPDPQWFADRAAEGESRLSVAELRARYLSSPASFPVVFTGEGTAVDSANAEVSLDGLSTPDAQRRIVDWLGAKGLGRAEVQYKLRDWLFSRQRYWGEPFPILYGPVGECVAVDESELPVTLPELTDYRPARSEDPAAEPQPALSRAPESWKIVVRNGVTYRRELNTMPQWAGSCWYYLRYMDPHNETKLVDPEVERYWMSPNGVDLYLGGVEHAVLHLLYARFWHKVLHDLGHVATPEPFGRLFNQGYILAHAYQDERGVYVDAEKIVEEPDGTFTSEGRRVTRTLGKMGKSLKNSVQPDEIFQEYGCDTLRLYEMYMGPLEQAKAWNTRAIVGVHRFLQRLWRNLIDEETGALRVTDGEADLDLRRQLHRTIAAVTEDLEGMHFNTAIARLIELNNELVGRDAVPRSVAEPLVLMLSPMAPHVAEELWERLGHSTSLAHASWPRHDPAQLAEEEVEIVVQVMGKKRGTVRVPPSADEKTIRDAALAQPNIARHLEGKTIRKLIHVPGKLLNIVAG